MPSGTVQAAKVQHRITPAGTPRSQERKRWGELWGQLWPSAVQTHRHLIKSSLLLGVLRGVLVESLARRKAVEETLAKELSPPHAPHCENAGGAAGCLLSQLISLFSPARPTSPMPRSLVTGGPNAGLAGAPRPSEDGARGRARTAERRGRSSRGRESRPWGLPADSNIPVKVSGSSRPDHLAPRSEKVKGVSGSPAPPSGRPLHALLPPARGR